ncbi:hypothetical protein [Hymenobacter sediminis]|uniref:hypothetical protein n=1 Tax=Hymenobacter sediminis TaxID=2218621 RepID=UPI00138FB873|nr:hypothetical protein [Hymenobacter sediminis]
MSDTKGYTDITTGVTVNEQRIRKISTTGVVSTLAGGPGGYADGVGSAARFQSPEGLAVDAHGTIYVAEHGGARIRKITSDGQVSTLAGTGNLGYKDGPASTAQFFRPAGIAVDTFGNVFVAEYGNHCIRKITPAGEVSTLAGTRQIGHTDGPLQTAVFDQPTALAIGKDGVLYVSEYHGNVIRTISAE